MSATASIVIIGDEILSGKVQDTNSPWLAKQLRELGTALERIIVIPDEEDLIARTVREFSETFTWVFTSGGIGPTHDDLTIAAIAKGLSRKVLRAPELEDVIRGWFAGAVPEHALKMAEIVEGTMLHWNETVKYPVMQVENIFIFPGIPEILQKDFEVVREKFRGDAYYLRIFYLQVLESELASTLHDLLADYPDIACGSYPVIGNPDWHVRVTLESRDVEYLESASDALRSRLDPAVIHAVE